MQKRRILLASFIVLASVVFLMTAGPGAYDSARTLYAKIKLFSTILDRIKEDYVEEKDPQELIDHAIRGMVDDLDPHTTYLTSDYFDEWNQRYEGYSGIGVTFDIIRDKITVMSIMSGGPSENAGLLAGDRIVAIDGETAVGLKRDEVPLKLMGPKGTKVTVSVERRGWEKPKDFTLVRDEIHVESVPYAFMISPTVGYISVVRFSATTGGEVDLALTKLENQGMEKLILDLRNNQGGYLETAVEVSDHFLPRGKRIVYTSGRIQSSHREFFATERATHPIKPLIVLVNRISASGSEIVAGAMQDWDRGLIIGETSFGKGLVQSQYRFSDGSALLMTTAKYYTPSGRLIQRPYDDKSLEEYYEEVRSDSLRDERENDESRPVYRTQILRRKVLGGGGITPDIFFKSELDTVSAVVRRMFFHRDRLFYTFTEDYVKDHPEMQIEFNDFLRNFKPNNGILQEFLNYIRIQGFEISNREFVDNKSSIQHFLKQSIADEIWGGEARYKVQLLRDKHLLEAMEYLDAAEELLARAYHVNNRG